MVMRYEGLDLNLLLALNALLEEGSVTKAAKRLNATQPAMSGALARLREYFGDELLIRDGREMVPTAQAECLSKPIGDVLAAIQYAVATKPGFDPAKSERLFRVMMSDYIESIVLQPLLKILGRDAPSVQIHVVPADQFMGTKLERGEIDLSISPQKCLAAGHPTALLTEDQYVAVVDGNNREVGDSVTLDQYLKMTHVVVDMSTDRPAVFQDWLLKHLDVHRRYAAIVPTYTPIPSLLIDTPFIGTIPTRLATRMARHFNIRLVKLPPTFPTLQEHLQWHRMRDHDLGLAWLRQQLIDAVKDVVTPVQATRLTRRPALPRPVRGAVKRVPAGIRVS